MTLSGVINLADELKPNAFSDDVKTSWINEVEGLVQTDVLLRSVHDVIMYDYAADSAKKLLVLPPHDKIYLAYLCAMIDFYNGEYNKYANTFEMFNTYFGEYMRWFATVYHPADGRMEENRYYISAYSIAVKHGFCGTEDEWLESLKGSPGAPGRDGQDGAPGRDGQDGSDGVSPEILVEDITGGHRVTIYDAEHPEGQTFNVLNGEGTSETRVAELIEAHDESAVAHGDLFDGKADLIDGKLDPEQLPEITAEDVGADDLGEITIVDADSQSPSSTAYKVRITEDTTDTGLAGWITIIKDGGGT